MSIGKDYKQKRPSAINARWQNSETGKFPVISCGFCLMSAETSDATELLVHLGPEGKFDGAYSDLTSWANDMSTCIKNCMQGSEGVYLQKCHWQEDKWKGVLPDVSLGYRITMEKFNNL